MGGQVAALVRVFICGINASALADPAWKAWLQLTGELDGWWGWPSRCSQCEVTPATAD